MRLLARNEALEHWFRNWLGVKLCLQPRDHAKGYKPKAKPGTFASLGL